MRRAVGAQPNSLSLGGAAPSPSLLNGSCDWDERTARPCRPPRLHPLRLAVSGSPGRALVWSAAV